MAMPSLEIVTTVDVRDERSSSGNALFDVGCEEMLESQSLRGEVAEGEENEEDGDEADNDEW